MVRPALQLYSVRDAQQPISELLHRIGAAGYDGVELAKVPTADYEALSSALSGAGLEVVGIHLRLLELQDKREAVINTCHELGCSDLVIAHVSPSHFRTRSWVDALANHITAQAATLADAGISLHCHNQCFEFQSVDTNPVVDHAAAVCNPSRLENSNGPFDQGQLQQYQRMAGTAGERLLDTLGSPPQLTLSPRLGSPISSTRRMQTPLKSNRILETSGPPVAWLAHDSRQAPKMFPHVSDKLLERIRIHSLKTAREIRL